MHRFSAKGHEEKRHLHALVQFLRKIAKGVKTYEDVRNTISNDKIWGKRISLWE